MRVHKYHQVTHILITRLIKVKMIDNYIGMSRMSVCYFVKDGSTYCFLGKEKFMRILIRSVDITISGYLATS